MNIISKTNLGSGVTGGESKHGIHSYVKPRDVERLKHNFSGVLAAFRCGQRALGQQKVMILRIAAQVIEYALLPKPLHRVPIIDLTVPDRITQVVRAAGSGSRHGLVADEEIEIGHDSGAVLSLPIRLGRHSGLVQKRLVHRHHRRNDEARLHVSGEPHLSVANESANQIQFWLRHFIKHMVSRGKIKIRMYSLPGAIVDHHRRTRSGVHVETREGQERATRFRVLFRNRRLDWICD